MAQSQDLARPSQTIHKIKTYIIEYNPNQEDYYFNAQVGNILSIQQSKSGTGNRFYITIQHSNKYSEHITYHVKAVLDDQDTYIHGFQYLGRVYLKYTFHQKAVLSVNAEKSYENSGPVNIFIKAELADNKIYPTY